MPRYISKEGVWHPAKEKVGLINKETKEPYIYEGPDRAALYDLWKEGVETFGENFRNDPDFQQRIRNSGYKSVTEFLKKIGYDKKKVDEDFEEKASTVSKHELPKRIEGIKKMGGGQDFSGSGKDKSGGFGAAPDLKE